MRLRTILLPIAFASGCNSNGLGSTDDMMNGPPPDMTPMAVELGPPDMIDNGQPSTDYPAPHPDPPQVADLGGRVLSKPIFVPVFFQNDDPMFTPKVLDFDQKVGVSKYWATTTKEYGVGPATVTMPVTVSESPMGTIADSAIQTWLLGKLNGNDPEFPAAAAGQIFILNYPAGVTITLPSRGGTIASCGNGGFGGYHSEVMTDLAHQHVKVAYAVIPRCAEYGGFVGIDAITTTTSHELIEAATDPFPMTDPAYGQPDDDHIYYEFLNSGGEVGDMCEQDPASYILSDELQYYVQRTWSNQSASDGHDPCVPIVGTVPYFAAVPVMNDQLSLFGGMINVTGVQIAVGESKMIELDLFSDGDLGGPMNVRVTEAASQGSLQFALDNKSGVNGEKLHLTITAVKTTSFRAGAFQVTASRGQVSHDYFGIVGN